MEQLFPSVPGVYLRRTTLATLLSVVSSFAYNAVAFGLPVIISSFFVQSMLTTIVISLALNLLFAFVGGLLAVRLVPRFGAWRMSLAGYSCQLAALLGLALIGRPTARAKASRPWRCWRYSCLVRALVRAHTP
jgi:asparagine N-glycosylation enzyme membrane subunit Stt3